LLCVFCRTCLGSHVAETFHNIEPYFLQVVHVEAFNLEYRKLLYMTCMLEFCKPGGKLQTFFLFANNIMKEYGTVVLRVEKRSPC
jgi:hypothetical protein